MSSNPQPKNNRRSSRKRADKSHAVKRETGVLFTSKSQSIEETPTALLIAEAQKALVSNNRRLRAIAEMTGEVIGSLSLVEQAKQIAAKIQDAFEVDACVIRLLEGDELTLLATAGISQEELCLKFHRSEGIACKVLANRGPLFIRNVAADASIPRSSTVPFTSYVGTTLFAKERPVGILAIYSNRQIDDFTETDSEHLQIVANHLSVSIVNNQLYKELRERRDELEDQMSVRRAAEDALRKSESQLRLVWENSLDGMRLIDGDGIVRLVNDAYCRLVRKDRNQVEGRPLSVVYSIERGEEILRKHRERFRARAVPSHFETNVSFWDGRNVALELSNAFLECEGQAPLLLTLFRDITERRKSDLRKVTFSTLSHALSSASTEKEVGKIVLDAAQVLLGWDAAYLFRYFPESETKSPIIHIDTVNGKKIDVHDPNFNASLSERMREVIRSGGQLILRDDKNDSVGFRPFGDENRPSLSILIVPVRNKSQVIAVLSVQSYRRKAYTEPDLELIQTLGDLCGGTLERISAQHSLTEERNLLRTLIDHLPDYIYVKDTESRHLLDNLAHRRLLGAKSAEEILGKTLYEFFPPLIADRYLTDDKTVLESGMPLLDHEEPISDQDGNQRWLLTTKIPLRDDHGKVAGLVGISRDITTHKLAEMRSTAFSSLGHRLSTATRIEDAAQTIVNIADELLGWDACYLHLCNADGSDFQTVVNVDVIEGRKTDFRPSINKPSQRMLQAMREGALIVLRETPGEPVTDFSAFGDKSRPSASILIVPVRNNQNVIGVLSIQSYRKRAYDHKSLDTLQALADHCAGALERLKVEAERNRIEQRNAVLSKLARSLNSATTEKEAAQVIINASSDLFGWDACTLDIVLRDTGMIHSLLVVDIIDGKRTTIEDLPDSAPSKMCRRVLDFGAELILREPGTIPTDSVPFGDVNRPAASLMNVPIRHGNEVIGLLSLQSYRFNAYTKDDLAALQSLADYCGGALERIRGIEALRESEERFRSLSESMPVGVFRTDAEGRRTYINARWYSITGVTEENALGEKWIESIHAEDRERVRQSWRTALERSSEWISEHRFAQREGTLRWVRVVATPFLSKEAKTTGYVGTVEDITERKRIETRDAAFSRLGKQLSSAATPQDAARVISEVADELFKWHAFTLDLYSPSRDRYNSILNIDTIDGQKSNVPHTNITTQPTRRALSVMEGGPQLILKDNAGEPLPDTVPFGNSRPSASIMLVPLRDGSSVVGVMTVQSYTPKAFNEEDLRTLNLLADSCSGALERIRAEDALRSSEVRFHSVWENSVDGMRLTDENGIIVAVNDAYCRLVGLPRNELEGKPFTVVYADTGRLQEFIRKYKYRFEHRIVQKLIHRRVTFRSGKAVDLEDTNSFIVSRDGRPLLLGLFRDITSQKRLEEELRQAQKLESIGRLAGGIAHDFNNILTVISGHASLLTLENLPQSALDSVDQISTSADRAANLTRQLLAFGRKQLIQARDIDLNSIVGNTTKMLQRLLGEDISLQVHFQSNLPTIHADPGMMEQVLLNLAINSRDAMPNGGHISIVTATRYIDQEYVQKNPEARLGQFICLSVIDTGCGIRPEHLQKIFEPFFTTKDVGKGTGLGLATVYGIVKQHNGWITVASDLGKGATFEVYLPVTSRPSETSQPQLQLGAEGGSETILLVEDELEVRALAAAILTRLGYTCLEAHSGAKALELWHQHKTNIDLILTDIIMPDGLSGRDLAEKIWIEQPNQKILFTSGYPKDTFGDNFALREGVNFLQKPYPPQHLAQVVRDCLDQGKSTQH